MADVVIADEGTDSRHSKIAKTQHLRRRGPTAVGVAAVLSFLGLWQVASNFWVDPFFLPAPTTVATGTWEIIENGRLAQDIGISLFRITTGWVLGSLVAIPIGLAMGASRYMRAIFDPFINFLRFVPALALITLFIVWFGTGEVSKIALITYATTFIVVINTSTGVNAIPPDKLAAARCLGATPWQVFTSVVAPGSVPYIYVGMRLSLATSFLVIVAAEIVAANSGIGYLIWSSRLYFRIDWLFGGIITIGLLGFIADRLWLAFGRRVLRRYLFSLEGL